MSFEKIPNDDDNIDSFAIGEMFRDVSHKRYKGKSLSQRQQQNYRKKYTSDSSECRQYPFLNNKFFTSREGGCVHQDLYVARNQ